MHEEKDLELLERLILAFDRRYHDTKEDAEKDHALSTIHVLERIKLFCMEKGYGQQQNYQDG